MLLEQFLIGTMIREDGRTYLGMAILLVLAAFAVSAAMIVIPTPVAAVAVVGVFGLLVLVLTPTSRLLVAVFLTIPFWPIPVMSNGILSRLYVGNGIIGILIARYLVGRGGLRIRVETFGRPLTWLCVVAAASLAVSLVDPVRGVIYDYPHESVPRWIVALTQLGLLTSVWLAPRVGVRFTIATELGKVLRALYVGAALSSIVVVVSSMTGMGSAAILGHRRPGSDLYWVAMIALPFMVNDLLKRRKSRAWLVTGVGLCSAAVAVSFTREAWTFGLLAVSVPLLITTQKKALALAGLSAFVLVVGLAGAFDFYNPDRVYGLERTNFYLEAISLFMRHPLLGVGSGNYQFFSLADVGVMQGGIAHNQLLTALAESGVLVVPVFIWLATSIVAFARDVTAQYRSGVYGLIVGWFSSWFFAETAIPTTAYGGNSHTSLYTVLIWLVLGVVVSSHRRFTVPTADEERIGMDALPSQPVSTQRLVTAEPRAPTMPKSQTW